jgi:hypothetical protein
MKKTSKKLVLAKETVRGLTQVQMGQVAGGTYYWSCPEYSCQNEFEPAQSYRCG